MKNIFLRCALLAAVAVGFSAPASAGELKLTMQNGRVTLIADNVPLGQILREWARIGQTTIVNADKLASPMMTLQLVDAPERDVLDILLRSAAGYIAAPRPAIVTNAAVYDRVTIMATSRAPAATAATVQMVPTFQRPPQPVDDDDPINVTVPPQMMQPPNPMTGQFPGMPPFGMQPGPNTPAAQPAPLTSPRPGALPTPPTPTPMFPNPYQPQVVRPGGPGGPGGGPGGPGGPGGGPGGPGGQ